MAKPTYTAPPNDPPVLGSPNFAADAQGFLGWFPTLGSYCEALADWLQTEYVAALAAGSAAAPSLAFASDPDTGLFRPAANQLAFAEGGVDMGRLYGRRNVVGTVAQSGGVPTQALFESGSNANGDYDRQASGVQVCRLIATTSTSGPVTVPLPAAFAAITYRCSYMIQSTTACLATVSGKTGTTLDLSCWDLTGARIAKPVELTARGHWF